MASTVGAPEPLTTTASSEASPMDMATKRAETEERQASRDKQTATTVFTEAPSPKGWRFWTVIAGLSATGTLAALEGTVVGTALPSIIADLQGGNLYVWVINGYFLTITAFQPLYGQLADIVGRKLLIVGAVAFFMIGSAISGAAQNMPMLVGGRAVQGIGGAGCSMMIEMIVSDMCSLRERGTYYGVVLGFTTIGTALGPIIGGLFVQYTTWRWVFLVNLPVGGLAAFLLLAFFKPKARPSATLQSIQQVDLVGNAVLILALVSVLISLSFGGAQYPWGSSQVVTPLVVGLVGLLCWLIYEFSSACKNPTVPLRLFRNRTTMSSFIMTFLYGIVLTWASYFVPIFFQGVYGSSPARAGVQLLACLLPLMVGGILGGIGIQVTGRYKPFHIVAFALLNLGTGLFALWDANSSAGAWIGYQIIWGIGAGVLAGTLLQSAQADLPERDVAAVTGFWAFVRSFGQIWGVAVSAAVFDNRTSRLVSLISSPDVRAQLGQGLAYQYATKAYTDSLLGQPEVRAQVIQVFTASLRTVWEVALAFGLLAFLFTFVEREVLLRKDLDTEFGLAAEPDNRGTKNREQQGQ